MVMVALPEPGAAIGLGLKLTVVPDGTPDADKLMALLKLPLIVVLIVDVPWFPCCTLSEAGEAEMVKFAAAVTVSVTVVLFWMPPPLPVTVMGYVPVAVLEPTATVIVELPEPGAGIGFGLKVTVVPEGTPDADRVTALLKPPLMAAVIDDAPWFPWATVSEAGEAEMIKRGSCCGDTVSVRVVFCWMPPPLPVSVIGYVPAAVLLPTVIVTPELPAPGAGIGLGLKLTVVPDGTPAADKVMALLNPPLTVVLTAAAPWFPWTMVIAGGMTEIEKLAPPVVTVNVTVVFCWMPPPLPVTVIG
jgi:hypothetical protein